MKHKFSKYSNIALHYSIWMTTESGENVISDERMQLLIAIRQKGSLMAASEHMGISYRKAWGDLRATERLLGFSLIEKHRGGKDGGASLLTEEGIRLVEAYKVFSDEFQEAVSQVVRKFKKTIKEVGE
jgi:molybdate transport system regulatory protein